MSQKTPIAQRVVLAISADGTEVLVNLGIGRPYEVSAGEWACPVWLDGLHGPLHDQHGVDSWQSMQLAYQLIAQRLGHFIEQGGRLLWAEGREPVELAELIPQLKARQ